MLAIGAVTTCLVVVFAPETRGRSVEALAAEVAAKPTQNVTIGGEPTGLA